MEPRPLRLLVVEDNEDDTLLLKRAIAREGYAVEHRRVETAEQMAAALAEGSWDAVISDYNLPHFSAPRALALFRERGIDIPFLVVSGTIGEETAVQLMKAGAHDYIAKNNLARVGPALSRELAEAVERRRRREAEAEREVLQAQLLQAQKMEAIGVLTAGVAHDFNNVLGAIQIYAELALMKVLQGAPAENELRQIQSATDRAAALTRQLLLFSRKQPMDLVPFNLNAVAADLLKMLRRIIGERITVETEFDPALPAVLGDAGGVEQVIMNLAVNARDAMPEGGTLRIATEAAEIGEEEARRHPERRPGRFARITVRDSGTGMDEATARRIFEPFFTTKGVGKGTGLGLSVVFGIVKQHGGWIELETAPGAGTRFAVHLPLADGPTAVGAKAGGALAELRGAGERVLLVEDEEGFRGVTAEGLRACGYEVEEASGVRQAMDLFERTPERYDLAVIDVALADGDGLDLALEMVGRRADLLVLLTSGYTDERSRLAAIRERGLPFLAKPWSFSALLVALREVLGARGQARG